MNIAFLAVVSLRLTAYTAEYTLVYHGQGTGTILVLLSWLTGLLTIRHSHVQAERNYSSEVKNTEPGKVQGLHFNDESDTEGFLAPTVSLCTILQLSRHPVAGLACESGPVNRVKAGALVQCTDPYLASPFVVFFYR